MIRKFLKWLITPEPIAEAAHNEQWAKEAPPPVSPAPVEAPKKQETFSDWMERKRAEESHRIIWHTGISVLHSGGLHKAVHDARTRADEVSVPLDPFSGKVDMSALVSGSITADKIAAGSLTHFKSGKPVPTIAFCDLESDMPSFDNCPVGQRLWIRETDQTYVRTEDGWCLLELYLDGREAFKARLHEEERLAAEDSQREKERLGALERAEMEAAYELNKDFGAF